MNVSKKEKIVGLIPNLELGGAERIMVTLMNYFSMHNVEVHLIVFNLQGELESQLDNKVIVHNLAIGSVSKGMAKCLKEIYTIAPNIVFSGIGHLNIAVAPFIPLMKKLLPQSQWITRETNIVSLENATGKYPKLFDWAYRTFYKNYDVIITQSEDMKEDLEKNYFSSSKIKIINNPVDIERVTKLATEMLDYQFDKSKINLVSVSLLRKQKRHDLMLKAVAKLPDNYFLTIVGAGTEEKTIKALAKELNVEKKVSFEGQQSNPYTYMKSADLFILTSEREGFPNVLIEANALGTPIVAFACQGGIKEIIDEGINGFFAPYAELDTLVKKIEHAASFNFDKKLIGQRTKEKYSREVILKKYQNIFLSEFSHENMV